MKKIILTIGLVSGLLASSMGSFNDSDMMFKTRNYPMNYDIAFASMKQTLLASNMHIQQINKKDGFISAKGTKSYDGKIYTFTFTISFDKRGEIINIKTIASYDLLQQENEVKGVSSFNIPIPVPWSKVFKYKGTTNVDNPQFFDSFYTTFDLNTFNYKMKYMAIEKPKKKVVSKKKVVVSKDINQTNIIKQVVNKAMVSDVNQTKIIKVKKPITKETNTTVVKEKNVVKVAKTNNVAKKEVSNIKDVTKTKTVKDIKQIETKMTKEETK